MNTRIEYLYRDGSNYKMLNEVVVVGTLTEDQITEILDCCEAGEYFIPIQVKLPEVRFGKITEDDHCWFEIAKYSFTETNAESTLPLTAEELLNNFKHASGKWDETAWLKGEKEKDEKHCD